MITLSGNPRRETGKGAKMVRSEGAVPAVVYGAGIPSESVSVNAREFEKVWRQAGEAGLIELAVGDSKKNVLIKDVQVDPLKGTPIHAAFYIVHGFAGLPDRK